MPDPLFVEMSIHHFDLHAGPARARSGERLGRELEPALVGFKGDIIGIAALPLRGRTLPVLYHANKISRGDLTSWYGDIVAEGEHATLSMVYPRLFTSRMGAHQTFTHGLQTDLVRASDPQAGQDASLAEFLDAVEQRRRPRPRSRTTSPARRCSSRRSTRRTSTASARSRTTSSR